MMRVTRSKANVPLNDVLLALEMPGIVRLGGLEAILPDLHALVQHRDCCTCDAALEIVAVDDADVVNAHGGITLQAEIAICCQGVANGVRVSVNAFARLTVRPSSRKEWFVPMIVVGTSIDNHFSQIDEGICLSA